jgi:hypothetical protein
MDLAIKLALAFVVLVAVLLILDHFWRKFMGS